MANKRSKIVMAVTGVLTAAVIVFSQLYCFQEACQNREKISKKEQHQQSEKTGGHKAFFTMPSSIIPPSAHIESNQVTTLIGDVNRNEKEPITIAPELPVFLNKLFHTLFRVIISPNAP